MNDVEKKVYKVSYWFWRRNKQIGVTEYFLAENEKDVEDLFWHFVSKERDRLQIIDKKKTQIPNIVEVKECEYQNSNFRNIALTSRLPRRSIPYTSYMKA